VENTCLRLFFFSIFAMFTTNAFLYEDEMYSFGLYFFVNVDLCECEILIVDNLIKKEVLTLLVLPVP